MKRYLTSQGLQTLWNQIKALFATKSELNQKASKTELNTLSESVSASLSEIEQTDIRQDASISSLSENKADKTALNKLSTDTTAALDKKVDKVSGMGLSHNDYTDEDKAKLNGIADGAEVNTIVAIQRNGTAITPKDRVVNILVPVKTSELNNDSTYQTAADVAETIVGVKLDLASGIITLTRKNGTTFTLDLPTEKIIKSGRYDSDTEEIVLVLEDESEIRFSASELIDEYYADESTLELYTDTADGNKKKFRIKTAYKNKIDGSEQTTNKTASVSSSSTETQYPTAKAVYNAVKDLATKVQTFSQASTRANIESGETISAVFGKIRKWFSDLKTVAFSGSYNDLSDKPSIGNGKVTIKQKGVEKGSFAMNQSEDATIELTDENTTYGIATSATAGLVKSGTDITVDESGNVSVNDNSHRHYYERGVYYGESGKGGYINFCTITFNSTYRDEPFSLQLSSRSREGTLTIFPNLANSTTLSNPQIFWHSEYLSATPVWYKLEANRIFLYWQKSENYDEMTVVRINVGIFTTKGVTFTWGNNYESSSAGLTNVSRYNNYVNCLSFNSGYISDYTIDSFWADLQVQTGCMGSVYLIQKASGVGAAIRTGWYNYIYIPHRDGRNTSGRDNSLYGSVILTPMTSTAASWVLRVSYSATHVTEAVKLSKYGISDISGLQSALNDKLSKKCGWCVTNGTTPYWFLIAGYTCTSEWFDLNTTFIASRNFHGGQAILQASIRTNTMGKIEVCQLKCLSKDNMFPTDCFAIAFKGTAGSKAEFQIWAKCPNQYQSMAIMPIYFGTRTTTSNAKEYWTLRQVNETYPESRADVRADGLFNHPTGFNISQCQVPEYRTLSGILEITDSNLATYFNSSTGVLTIPNGVTTILFNTSSKKKVFNIIGGCAVNGYRLTIAGYWLPAEKTSTSTTGCFSSFIYGYRGGAVSYGTQYSSEMREAFEDFIYFNGVWYSKAY